MALVIERIPAVATRALRAAVLRPGQQVTGALQGDEDTGVVALGAFASGRPPGPASLVGCCLLLPEQAPAASGAPPGPGWRLRGMAVLPSHRGGTGGALLASAIDLVSAEGGGILWCHARTAARGLYARGGLVAVGEEFLEVGIPHLLMWRQVDRRRAPRPDADARERPEPADGARDAAHRPPPSPR